MFLNFWIGWALVGLLAATALFAWSVKTKQFSDSKRASLLPFDDVAPEKTSTRKKEGRALWITVIFLFVVSTALLVLTIYLIF